LGRRGDGFHLLDSLIGFAAIHDDILARPAIELSLAINGPFAGDLAAEDDNLVLRAARALAAHGGVPRGTGAAITLVKNLPVASGIGGGSSDAAAALRILDALWGLQTPAAELAAIAAGLGADVPVCLAARTAIVGGIGTDVSEVPPLPGVGLVLANPGIALPTAEIFAAYAANTANTANNEDIADRADSIRFDAMPADALALAQQLAELRNDLGPAACRHAPVVADVLDAIGAAPGCLLARLSGSGATCFGLFADVAAAAAAADRIGRAHSGWWVRGTEFIDRAPEIEEIEEIE
jgi:4-diphosphocytidyl-2-C-methyl-D-erythritol kinase